MLLRGRLKTKDFLLQRNVACDSCCVLCNCTCETAAHLIVYCPYSQEVWKSLLEKLDLEPISCENPLELLESIIFPIEQQKTGLLTPGKLLSMHLFGTFGLRGMQEYSEVKNAPARLCYRTLFKPYAVELIILT